MKKIAVLVVVGVSLAGCAHFPGHTHADKGPVHHGAVVGGVAGGIIGGVATGTWGGAAVGAGIGAAAGAAIASATYAGY